MKTPFFLVLSGVALIGGAYAAWKNQMDWGLRECCNAGSIGPDLLMFGLPSVVGAILVLSGIGLGVWRAGRPGSRAL